MSQFRNPEIDHLEGELAFRHAQRQMVMDADFNESKIHRNADGTFGSGGSTTFAQDPAKYHSEMAGGHKKIATEHNDRDVRISHQEAQERHEGAHIAQKNAKNSSLSDRHVATTHSSMADRSTVKAMATSQSKVPASAKEHASYHRGYDPDITRPDGGHGAHVFEFPSEKHQAKFLESVGGAPHPYGGHRAILSGGADAQDADKTKHDSKTGQFTSGGGGAAAGSNHHEVLSGHGWEKDKHSRYIMDKNGDRYVHKDHPGHHISTYTRDAGPSTHKGDWRHDTTTHEGNNETGLSMTNTVAKGSGHKSLAEHLAEFHGTKRNP